MPCLIFLSKSFSQNYGTERAVLPRFVKTIVLETRFDSVLACTPLFQNQKKKVLYCS